VKGRGVGGTHVILQDHRQMKKEKELLFLKDRQKEKHRNIKVARPN